MKAKRILYRKLLLPGGAIVEMKLWQVADNVPPSTHGFKYSLYYGCGGTRLVGYDNERGKGDHVHYGDREVPYHFVSVEKLIHDFMTDVRHARGVDDQSEDPHGPLR